MKTKLDESFRNAQFNLNGCRAGVRQDSDKYRGGPH